MKALCTQTKNISIGNRLIEAKEGQEYELTEEEMRRIPTGYFIANVETKKEKKKNKEVD